MDLHAILCFWLIYEEWRLSLISFDLIYSREKGSKTFMVKLYTTKYHECKMVNMHRILVLPYTRELMFHKYNLQ